jgi:hypothetical protein
MGHAEEEVLTHSLIFSSSKNEKEWRDNHEPGLLGNHFFLPCNGTGTFKIAKTCGS